MSYDVELKFQHILKRIYSEENYERRHSVSNLSRNDDEEQLWKLIQSLWPEVSLRTDDFDNYPINVSRDKRIAQREIDELEFLLNKLGWQ